MDSSNDRHVTYIGGPWDGATDIQAKAYWPPQNRMPTGFGREHGYTSSWPDAWAADTKRYMPRLVDGSQLHMVWAAPDDKHAPPLIPRPESDKDYGDVNR
jgi:hypothetical protein